MYFSDERICDGEDIEVNRDGLTSHPFTHYERSYYASKPKDLMVTDDLMMIQVLVCIFQF
jgi:hypothetical protein